MCEDEIYKNLYYFFSAHGLRNTSSTQNYLILALALVCIVGVAALTIGNNNNNAYMLIVRG